MKTIKLNNGVEMPILGFGVYQVDPAETKRVVSDALEVGYRSIDTAASYGNEEGVGSAIAASGIPRKELFITTKLWLHDAGYDNTKKAFDRSLKRLGLDYLDLYLIHQPFNDVYGSWRAMEELYKQGLIRAIGISNFQPDRVTDLMMFNEVAPAVNQIETHPLHQQIDAHKVLSENDVQTESWGPFAEGRNNLFTNEALMKIASVHGKSVAQVILRWLIQRDIVVIPKSVNKDRMIENLDVFDFELSAEHMQVIKTLDNNKSAFFDIRDPEIVKMFASFTRNT